MHFVAGVDRGCVVSKAMVTPGSMSREVKPRRSALIAAIRQDRGEGQGNFRELRFFTGLRPSEEIALKERDFDEVRGTLPITKTRVYGIDKDTTKTREDRVIHLSPRAIAVLIRQLALHRHSHAILVGECLVVTDCCGSLNEYSRPLKPITIVRAVTHGDGLRSRLLINRKVLTGEATKPYFVQAIIRIWESPHRIYSYCRCEFGRIGIGPRADCRKRN